MDLLSNSCDEVAVFQLLFDGQILVSLQDVHRNLRQSHQLARPSTLGIWNLSIRKVIFIPVFRTLFHRLNRFSQHFPNLSIGQMTRVLDVIQRLELLLHTPRQS